MQAFIESSYSSPFSHNNTFALDLCLLDGNTRGWLCRHSESIKKSWVEQRIWNNKRNKFASGWWKHEEPLELESEPETDTEAETSSLSYFPKPQPNRGSRRAMTKSDGLQSDEIYWSVNVRLHVQTSFRLSVIEGAQTNP
jgi:hypothetical protein